MDLLSLDDPVVEAQTLRQCRGLPQLAGCQAGRLRRDGERLMSQDVVCRGSQEGAVHAPGIGDYNVVHLPQEIFEGI